MILADRDLSAGWVSTADAAEKRYYYLQNWRADTCAIVNDAGMVIRNFRYSAYGSRTEVSSLDYNRDGASDFFDYLDFVDALGVPEDRADINRDGAADSLDYSDFVDMQSAGEVDNTCGKTRNLYAGYENDPSLEKPAVSSGGDSALLAWESMYHVRNRVYSTELGRWTRRDPLGYHDGMGLMEYVKSRPEASRDWRGLAASAAIGPSNPLRHPRICCGATLTPDPLTHCETVWGPCGPGEIEYQVWVDRSPCRRLRDGTPCSQATPEGITNCLTLMPHSNHPDLSRPYGLGNNCQKSVESNVTECCLLTSWTPSFHSGVGSTCVEWESWETPGDGGLPERHVMCVRYATGLEAPCISRAPDQVIEDPNGLIVIRGECLVWGTPGGPDHSLPEDTFPRRRPRPIRPPGIQLP